MTRICIYPKDVQILTGKSERYGRNILNKIRKLNNKKKDQPVTIYEFCEYLNLQVEEIIAVIK